MYRTIHALTSFIVLLRLLSLSQRVVYFRWLSSLYELLLLITFVRDLIELILHFLIRVGQRLSLWLIGTHSATATFVVIIDNVLRSSRWLSANERRQNISIISFIISP